MTAEHISHDALPAIDPSLAKALAAVRQRATGHDRAGDWPADDLADLAAVGALRWSIGSEFGGLGLSPLDLHEKYEAVASASLSTALILSQRDSAAALVAHSPDSPLAGELLPPLARGEFFMTIGIAQLTTSHQGGPPALRATAIDGGWELDGLIPWSSGVGQARWVIAGAVLPDGQQILFALPTDLAGVAVQPPMPLVALASSWTSQVNCHAARLESRWMLRGPAARVLDSRGKGVPVGQAFLAMGLCEGALDLIRTHDSPRAHATAARFAEQLSHLRADVLAICQPDTHLDVAKLAPRIRGRCNELASRITSAAVALFKGSALVRDHPAQRLARESMFLLVWSCPDPVIECTVDLLTAQTGYSPA